jgi:hypothetical protein
VTQSESISERLQGVDASDLADVHDLGEERLQLLWVLVVGKRAGIASLTPFAASSALRDAYGIHLPRQRASAILEAERATVAPLRAGGRRAYQVMRAGEQEVAQIARGVVLVEPELGLSSLRRVQAVLGGLTGVLRVCDPYVDGRTLDLLANCRTATGIRLLTMNVAKPNVLRREAKAFNAEYGGILELRLAARHVLHDRYVIDDGTMTLFGTSLNSIGAKQSFVVRVGRDIRELTVAAFDAEWTAAAAV